MNFKKLMEHHYIYSLKRKGKGYGTTMSLEEAMHQWLGKEAISQSSNQEAKDKTT